MQKKSFYDALSDLLIKKGIQEDKIDDCISKFADNHDLSNLPDDFSQIDIFALSEQIADEYHKSNTDTDFDLDIVFPDFESELEEVKGLSEKESKPKNFKRSEIKRIDITKNAERVKGTPLYWCLFILLLPITVPIFLALCVFIGAVYVAISVIIVAFVLLLVAVIAAGTASSLVGVIYGITQFTKSVPIALFELGIGIALGGLTMLLSVLIYNFSIRLLPRLYKAASGLTKNIFHGIGVLNTALKKECVK